MPTLLTPVRLLAAVTALALLGCGLDPTYTDPPCPEAPAGADGYEIALTISPADRHVGEVLSFTFKVKRDGVPVDGLSTTGSYRHLGSGASGPISLSARGPGEYGGSKPLFSEGTYSISIEFSAEGRNIKRGFPLALENH